MRFATLAAVLILSGCTATPYRLCDTNGCTQSLTTDAAVDAARAAKAWGEASDVRLAVTPEVK